MSELFYFRLFPVYALIGVFICTSTYSADAQCLTRKRQGVHVVQPKENLYRISRMYNLSIEDICKWNNIKIDDPLHKCQELIVSGNFSSQPPPEAYNQTQTKPSQSTVVQPSTGNRHTVRPGETIAILARRYGYTEERFREFNAMPPGEQPTPGSILLSSDCTCDRIAYNETKPTNYSKNTTDKPRSSSSDPFRKPTTTTSKPPATTTTTAPPASSNSGKASASFMSSEELSMVDEINLMRSNPSGYIKYVRAYADDQKNNGGFPISDQAVNELIQELQALSSLSVLKPIECISTAAKNHGNDILKMGDTNHKGSDGSWPWDRVRRACPQMTDGNENLVGGPDNVRESVIILLIDDGIPTRGHRKTLLKKEWKYVACHKIGKVGIMPNCWVQKFGY